MTAAALRRLGGWLAAAACAAVLAAAPARADDAVRLEWKGAVHRLGAPIPVKISTSDEALSRTLAAAKVVLIASDGRERRLRSSATESKVTVADGRWSIDVDAAELSDLPPPGAFQLSYEIVEGSRTKPLVGKLAAPIANPMERLEKDPDRVAVLLETDLGPILIALRKDKAPVTVKNFVKLVADGFYDGTTFHRILRGFIVQGGAHKPDGSIKTSPSIQGEFTDLGHERGAVSMARREEDKNSGSCQFFVSVAFNRDALDGRYAVFGKVIEGMSAIDRLSLTPVERAVDTELSKPVKPPVLIKATVVEKP